MAGIMTFLGQPWHFYLVVAVTSALLYLYNKSVTARQEQSKKAMEAMLPNKDVHLFGGPLNGKTEKVADQLSYFIVPYMPDDPSEAQEIGRIGEKVLFAPSFAYYQQVGEPDSYFYRRDLTMDEVQAYQTTGKLPEDMG